MRRHLALATALPILLAATGARADRRAFTFIYEPKTMDRGGLELEWYMTGAVSYDPLAKRYDLSWTHQVEAEYGITDHIDISMYQMFSHSAWLGYKLRGRWRPVDTGVLFVDPMLYLEFIQHAEGAVSLEERIILGRTLGPLIISLDSFAEQERLGRSVSFLWSEGLGIAFQIRPWIVVGLENQLRFAWAREASYTSSSPLLVYQGVSYYVGPTLSFATRRMWWDVNFSARAALSSPTPESQPRFLLRVLWGIFL